MTDATYHGWAVLSRRSVTVTRWNAQIDRHAPEDEAECIPDWAALAVAIGLVLALCGFVASWLSDKAYGPAILTIGLVIAAVGMRAAERAVHSAKV
jgi:hypothetical protein